MGWFDLYISDRYSIISTWCAHHDVCYILQLDTTFEPKWLRASFLPPSSRYFWDLMILVNLCYNSGENEVLFVKKGLCIYGLTGLLDPSGPNAVSRPHILRSIDCLKFHHFIGYISYFWKKWVPISENWSLGFRLMVWY